MSQRSDRAGGVPRFSIVSAVYQVSAYLDDFIASIEAQDFPLDHVEVIMVDDGSTDDGPRKLAEWQRRRPGLVTVVTKVNGGQASARNVGLDHATGQWVTLPDPDDTLSVDYLSSVDAFLSAHPDTQMVATNRVLVFEATGKEGNHPLASYFAHRSQLRNLDLHPKFFHGSAPAAFFRNDVLNREHLRFDERIRPNFEDGHFCSSYLLRVPAPQVAFVRSAKYYYRKRSDNTSTLNTSRAHPGRYTAVLEHGYLDVLRQAVERKGFVPGWLHTFLLYELSWYFQEEDAATHGGTALADDAVAAEFNRLLARIAPLLDPETIRTFNVRRFRPTWREVLLHGYDSEPWHTSFAHIDKVDLRQRSLRVTYRYTQGMPVERFFVDGSEVQPLHGKIRAIPYFGRTAVRERIAWLPYGTIRVSLNGADVVLVTEEPDKPVYAMEGWRARNALVPSFIDKENARTRRKLTRRFRARVLRRLSRTRPVRHLFGNAWVLIDRIHDADDSAEHLFQYLRAHRAGTNAWFVIEKGTPDWDRLRKQHRFRTIAHGSVSWKLLMLNCDQLISSHADAPIVRPSAIAKLTEPGWRFVFLQHGVIKDDLSSWLNPKDVDIFVASTPAEFDSIAGDDTTYRYTTREVKLTGLPRFDRVLEAGRQVPPDRRDLILIAPTWRQWLVTKAEPGTQRWNIGIESFRTSDFARNWLAVVSSPELADLAERSGLRIGLLMHPNLQAVMRALELPPSIEMFGFDGDVRTTFARARVLVTDYSSMAFNTAYIERPTVYFQFDRDLMRSGAHVGRQGYFDYERDGFGPVTFDPQDAVAAISEVVATGPAPSAEYLSRIRAAFPLRDGRCCERVADAIAESVRPVTWGGTVTEAEDADFAHQVAVDEAIAAVEAPQDAVEVTGEAVVDERAADEARPSDQDLRS